MVRNERNVIVGVFDDRNQAQQAVNELKRAGFRDDQIGVAARDEGRTVRHGDEEGSYAEEGAVTGVAAGAGIGGLWALGIAAGALPAIGPVIAGGVLASVLASAAAGAAVGGLAGALIGLGIPEDEAGYYEDEFKAGRTIVTVKTDGRFNDANDILRRFGAYDIDTRREAVGRETSGVMHGREDERTLQAHEEQLRAHTEETTAGEVRVGKEVHAEQQTLEVPVTREEVVIERHPVEGREVSPSEIREGEEVRVPVREEEVHVEKQPVVTEEVEIGKRKTKDTERVSGTVRKEDIHVEREGDVDVREENR